MKNIFFLPSHISISKAKQLWKDQDRLRYGVNPSYVDNEFELFVETERSFKQIVVNAPIESTIVIYSPDLMRMNPTDLSQLLSDRAHEGIKIRILNPNFLLDPNSPDCTAVLALMGAMQKVDDDEVKEKRPRPHSGFGYKPLAQELVDKIRSEKNLGKTVKQIAIDNNISRTTVNKYTKDIVAIKREKTQQIRKIGKLTDYSAIEQNEDLRGTRFSLVLTEFLRSQRAFSTKNSYFRDMKVFKEWTKSAGYDVTHEKDISLNMGFEYFEFLQTKYSEKSVNRIFKTVRSFLNYCKKRGYVQINEFSTIKLLKINTHIIESIPFTNEELKLFLSKALILATDKSNSPTKRMNFWRNFVGYFVLSSTGMRRGSLMGIQKKHISVENNLIKLNILDKNDGRREITLDQKTSQVVAEYINTYYQLDDENAYLMFGNIYNKNEQMKANTFNMAVRLHAKKCGIDKKITTHSFRSTFASQAFQNGFTIRDIQLELGHRNLNQTAAYLKFAENNKSKQWVDLGGTLDLVRQHGQLDLHI